MTGHGGPGAVCDMRYPVSGIRCAPYVPCRARGPADVLDAGSTATRLVPGLLLVGVGTGLVSLSGR
ncbi:hypothetical protein GCM10020256_08840 [Streptomyces thermocoprophilus]